MTEAKYPQSNPLEMRPTLLLSGDELASLLQPGDYLTAVEQGFRALGEGRAFSPPPLHLPCVEGGFHAKAASLNGEHVALKLNGNFPGNPRRGLPTIQGAILLCNAETGALLAIMDSIELTIRRTAAATALAALHLARRDAARLAICGCGAQALAQAEALADVLPITRGVAWDIDPAKAQRFALKAADALGCEFYLSSDLAGAARGADVIVTCTTSRAPFLDETHVAPGVFIAAVGADNPEKSEIASTLMAKAAVVADVTDQCAHMGDLHHAIAAGVMCAADVRAELADLVTGAHPGRCDPAEIIVFDSTGVAVQDVASAALAYERARASGRGVPFTFTHGA